MNDNQNPSTATVSLKGSKLDRTISSILALGPLAVIAFVAVSFTTSLFAARYVFRGVSSWFTTETRTSVTASVEKVLPAFELKPLVVCDSGIGIVPRNRNGEPFPGVSGGLPSRDKAVLEFEYEGSAEYVVNLANAKSEQVGDPSHPKVRIEIDPPFVPNDSVAFSSAAKTDRYLATYGSDQKMERLVPEEPSHVRLWSHSPNGKIAGTCQNGKRADGSSRTRIRRSPSERSGQGCGNHLA